MKLKLHILILLATVFCSSAFAQYPRFFQYDDENGLPSNEAYSIITDHKGFIWLGCDAGLYKFDGVRYIAYKCPSQKSKSMAGLTISASNRLYCTNFQSQLFYVENNTLNELDFPYRTSILHITCDKTGNLLVNHNKGFAIYNEKTRKWKNHVISKSEGLNKINQATRSARVNAKNEACFLTASGIARYNNHRFTHISNFIGKQPDVALSSEFMITWFGEEQWIFPFAGGKDIYRCKKEKIEPVLRKNLKNAVAGKTITNTLLLSDGNLWICTYNGVIRYNPKNDQATTYYDDKAFSDCLIDREGNYWFSTLQSGLIRIPNLDYTVWNNFQNNKLTRLTNNGKQLYFANVNGDIGVLELHSEQLQFLQHGSNSSIQTLTYSPENNTTYFYTNKNLYTLQNGKVLLMFANAPPVKDIVVIDDRFLICSSFGVYISNPAAVNQIEKIGEHWAREAEYDRKNQCVWVATNNGLEKYKKLNGQWKLQRSLFKERQVLSTDFDYVSGKCFAVTFDGRLYSIDRNGFVKSIGSFSDDIQSYRVLHSQGKVFLATNQGVLIFDLKTGKKTVLNTHSGISSNNVLDISIIGKTLWLATGKGLQHIPLKAFRTTPKPLVYLKNEAFDPQNVNLEYGEPLILLPETTTYNSNGVFEYAYRINGGRIWNRMPGTIDQILLQNIPTGKFEIELKVIDHFGQDSANTIMIKGYAHPPFWNTWWFTLLEAALILLIVYYIFKRQLAKRQKELLYQNELNTMKLTAIKSQMNPHFIFNVLSSIKGYIYENDRQKATSYLDDFSDLMRSVLEMSEVHYVSLAEELKLLKLYIELEGMMLEDFNFNITISENISAESIQIPSLLLQPYIENAFKHGLRHKKGQKTLHINIANSGNSEVVIELIDNGIGRKAANDLNANNLLKPQSFASEALEKRISLINEQKQQHIRLKIIDLYDDQENASGTKIQLILTVK